MALTNPTIIGPISELTTSLRLQGQLAGSTVTVFTAAPVQTLLAKGVATSSDQRFPLLPGAHLSAAHKLFAMQDLGGDSSVTPGGDLLMGVQPKPQSAGDLGTVGFRTHPFECGRYMWVAGGIPGADVHVTSGAQLLGAGPILRQR